ncbi:MAG: hypothetical protein GX879_09755 [Bacteroidales bacterium]|nr:hypothetical protein [Bacteroidales bacterium]
MKKNLSLIVLMLSFSILFTSCVTTRTANLTKSEGEKLELFTTKLPSKAYTEICYIQADGGIFHTPQKLLNGLKKKAIEVKADAVINIKYDFQAWYPIVSGTAIKYTEN